MLNRKFRDRHDIQRRIFQSLGYNQIGQSQGLDRIRQQLNTDLIAESLNELSQKSQNKKKKVKQALNNMNYKNLPEASDEMRQLEWRLEVLRQDRKQSLKKNGQLVTFQQLYNRQKNKYSKFRERQKIKIKDPKYLEMIGSTLMRRQNRKLQSLQKIQRHISKLDQNIQNHAEKQTGGAI